MLSGGAYRQNRALSSHKNSRRSTLHNPRAMHSAVVGSEAMGLMGQIARAGASERPHMVGNHHGTIPQLPTSWPVMIAAAAGLRTKILFLGYCFSPLLLLVPHSLSFSPLCYLSFLSVVDSQIRGRTAHSRLPPPFPTACGAYVPSFLSRRR